MKTISILNLKGGVGKTTTAINMAELITRGGIGNRVLLIDADPQGNLSQFYGVTPVGGDTTLELLNGTSEPFYPDFVSQTGNGNIDIIPADMSLLRADVSAIKDGTLLLGSIQELRDAIAEDNAYQYIIIDCPPAFSAATMAALYASDEVIIPIKLDAFSTGGMAALMEQVGNMRAVNQNLSVAGCLITMYHATPELEQAAKFLRGCKSVPVFDTVIRRSDRVDASTYAKQGMAEFSPHSSAAIDYKRFVEEYLGRDAK